MSALRAPVSLPPTSLLASDIARVPCPADRQTVHGKQLGRARRGRLCVEASRPPPHLHSIGGMAGVIARSQANLAVVEQFVEGNEWCVVLL